MGRRIATRRKHLGLRQNQLAEILGISNNYMSDIERGVSNPGIELLVEISFALDVTPDYLLLGTITLRKIPKRISDAMELCSDEDIEAILPVIEHIIEMRQIINRDK